MTDPIDLVRQGLHRVVELYNPATKQFGTGYGITDSLVMTARHVVEGASTCTARPLCDLGGRIGGSAWRQTEWRWFDRNADVALVELPDEPWADASDRGLLQWAQTGDAVPCLTRGFPWFEGYKDSGIVRDLATARGRVHPDSASKKGLLTVDVDTSPLPRQLQKELSPWGGMSGAALLSDPGRELLGVIVRHAQCHAPGRLLAVPAAQMLRDAEFARLVKADFTDLPMLSAAPSAAVTDLIELPYQGLPRSPVEWQLLMPAHRVVPFRGRATELQLLRAWCHGDALIDIALVVGAGGAGKSRLAAELCAEVRDAGWFAGRVEVEGVARALGRGGLALPAPALVTIDYAERSGSILAELINRFGRRRRGPRLRLLLLAREGADDDLHVTSWWRRLHALTRGLAGERTRHVINLQSVRLTVDEREQHFDEARRAFAPYLGVVGGNVPAPDLTSDTYNNVLLVHIAALLASRGDSPVRDHLLTQLLAREQARWLAVQHSPAISGTLPAVAFQLITCVTLAAPDANDLWDLLSAVPSLSGDSPHQYSLRTDLARWLLMLSPGGVPLPLSLDILVEQLLAETSDLDKLVVGVHRNAVCTRERSTRMLAILLLAAPHRQAVAMAVSALLRNRLTELVTQALEEPAGQLANLLVDALGYAPSDDQFIRLAAETAQSLPCPGGRFAGLGAALAAQAVQNTRPLPPSFAELATDLAAWQLELEQVEQAREAVTKAVNTYRQAPGGSAARDQTRAVHLLATCQARTGQTAEALATVRRTVTQLAESAVSDPAHLTALAATQAEAGIWALRSSLPLEAATWIVNAIRTVQKIADQPDVDLAEIAVHVDTLRLAFVTSGITELAHATPLAPDRVTMTPHWELRDTIAEASGALVEILAAHSDILRPDQLPGYVDALYEMVQRLLRLDQYDAGFHALDGAVDRYRELYDADPGLYKPGLARALKLRGLVLGPAELRLNDAREAVALYQELSEHDYMTYSPLLAEAWRNVGIAYNQLVQPAETLTAYGEAAAIYRELADQDSAFVLKHAEARSSIGVALLCLGRLDEAEVELGAALLSFEAGDPSAAVEPLLIRARCRAMLGRDFVSDLWRAIGLARHSASDNPDSTDDLVNALFLAGDLLLAAGRLDEAHECAAEAVMLARDLIENESGDEADLAGPLALFARTSARRGQLEQAEELSSEAVAITRPLLEADAGARTVTVSALAVRCETLAQLGRHEQILDPAREAIGYLRDLVEDVPEDFGQLLGVMTLYANSLNLCKRPAEARAVIQDARQIAERLPGDIEAPLLTRRHTIGVLVDSLILLGDLGEALRGARQAVSDADGTEFELQCQFVLAVAEHAYGQDRARFGRYAEAEDVLSSCVSRLHALGAQQTHLTPHVEQRLLECGRILVHVLRQLNRDDDADQLEVEIANSEYS